MRSARDLTDAGGGTGGDEAIVCPRRRRRHRAHAHRSYARTPPTPPKAIAALAGVAPYTNDSGMRRGKPSAPQPASMPATPYTAIAARSGSMHVPSDLALVSL
jgi:hypothetical protein